MLAEARGGGPGARFNDRIERGALMAPPLTIFGAATMLGPEPREVAHLIRDGSLNAWRRGRHSHIDRILIEARRRQAR